MVRRLHLGVGRLEKLDLEALKIFTQENWINLGEPELRNPKNKPLTEIDYSKVNFRPFFYSNGARLPFEDRYFTFIFSEHFFEHLFLEDALGLLRECYRVLDNNGIIRTVVPDADLRPVPERLGFPSDSVTYSQPEKHKTRWSIYSLRPALELSGFKVNPIKYYSCEGILIDNVLSTDGEFYLLCKDRDMLRDFSFIKRRDSLIVDGLK